ncbi:MAG: N-acetylmuramoyl-L-alanine amidase [Xanthomonadales bacterium]|nr:N-acetylmuramoyl-L-alanine amidase [Gammaproteobacteria bacterium]MBT8053017.1 N-acetylmuramoyl-L-alanine amidase [Gammaproteobacteria bacterium]NND57909.1 N-acetylmuramoyl-L-alanine amidase [Xanthomonadales bacterium]NNK50789.1 N-acetylmuramoyl-L-alanine amidase [Xanthomonadales bacterium]
MTAIRPWRCPTQTVSCISITATRQDPVPGTTANRSASLQPPAIRQNLLPYAEQLEHRPLESVNLAVIHCTELPDLSLARVYGERTHYPESETGNSGHFYIERNGEIERWVPEERIAHHVRGYNRRSVGIELVNQGRYPDWLDSRSQAMTEPYPVTQLRSLYRLLHFLHVRLPALRHVAGHDALDTERVPASDDPGITVFRKRDPGPLFPWDDLLSRTGLNRFLP